MPQPKALAMASLAAQNPATDSIFLAKAISLSLRNFALNLSPNFSRDFSSLLICIISVPIFMNVL